MAGELPRGWTTTASGSTPVITIPAVAGIAHVLTGIELSARDTQNTTGFANTTQLLVNGVLFGDLNMEDWSAGATTWSAKDTFSWSGELPFPIDTQILFALFSSVSQAVITVTGYDI